MISIIDHYPSRYRIDLGGLWDFSPAKHRTDVFPEKQPVPGVWEATFRHFRHRGQGWYRRFFVVPRNSQVRLYFGAASYLARVWIDGKLLGQHSGAHTAFEFTTPLQAGTHELSVLVDNTFGPHNSLYTPSQDIFLFGGLPRGVFAELLPSRPLGNVAVLPRKTSRGWTLEMRNVPADAVVTLDGKKPDLRQVELWSPDHPRLYTVRVETVDDVWQGRIGFRTIETRGRQLLLNGKPLILKGVNRHEFHPDFGSAVPLGIHLRDIELLKELGANFVRGSHYPNDPLFLDLCDENGILFWEELSHWQPKEADLQNPKFLEDSLRQLEEVVVQKQHHPSIILWGMCNELDGHVRAARPVIRKLAARFRKLDPTRPVTYATCRWDKDVCLDLVDVVSFNLYPGWYLGKLEETEAKTRELIDVADRRGKHKPIILSEFGAAAMPGCKAFEMRKWTENYQADLLKQVIDTARRSGKVCGVAVWQFCDVRTTEDCWWTRIREYNNKGIVSEYRQPKMGFYAVQDAFKQPWKALRSADAMTRG